MFALAMTIVSHSLVIFAMRFTEAHNGNRYTATVSTFVVCAIISFCMMDSHLLFQNNRDYYFALGMGIYNSVCMTMGMVISRLSTGINGTPISTTFNRLGILIPTLFSVFVFGERPGILQMVGIALAVTSIIYINSGKGSMSQNHIQSMKLLLILLAVGGLIDLNTKIYERYGNPELNDYFVFVTFFFCILVSLTIMLTQDRKFDKGAVMIGAMTGIPNTFILYFSLKAVEKLPAYIVFPGYSAGVILLVNIVNFLVFKEKINKEEKRSTVLIAIALILINI